MLRGSNFGLKFFYVPYIYDTRLTTLIPFRRNSYSGFLRSEKIHRPRPGLNPRTSDPVASVRTTGPPGSTRCRDNAPFMLRFQNRRLSYCAQSRCLICCPCNVHNTKSRSQTFTFENQYNYLSTCKVIPSTIREGLICGPCLLKLLCF